ncbi:MAG: PAS domain S-box protein [Rhodobacterales bacterium]|nr:PAS domain S-box protein [Rhodobacterales bacterium]
MAGQGRRRETVASGLTALAPEPVGGRIPASPAPAGDADWRAAGIDALPAFVDALDVCLLVLDTEGDVRSINRAGAQLLGYEPDDLVGRNWFDTCLPTDVRRDLKRYQQDLIDRDSDLLDPFENEVVTRDGGRLTVAWRNTVVRGLDRRVLGTFCAGVDVTRQRRLEDQERRESRRTAVLVSLQNAATEMTERQTMVAWLRAVMDLTGSERGWVRAISPSRDGWRQVTLQDDRELARDVPLDGHANPFTDLGTGVEGDAGVARSIDAAVGGDNGPSLTLCVADKHRPYDEIDQTTAHLFAHNLWQTLQRERTLAALEESERRAQDIISGAGAGMWEWDLRTGALTINDRWAEIVGAKGDDLRPATLATLVNLIHPDDLERVRTDVRAHLWGETASFQCEMRVRHGAGHWIWVIDRGKVVERDSRGRARRMSGFRVDVTHRKEVELARQGMQDRLAMAERIARFGNLDWNLQTGNIIWSAEVPRILGIPPADLGHTLEEILTFAHPDERPAVDARIRQAAAGGDRFAFDSRIIRGDGLERRIQVRGEVITGAGGKPERVLGTVQDVTEKETAFNSTRALRDIAEQVGTGDEAATLERALAWCETISGSTLSALYVVSEDGTTVRRSTLSARCRESCPDLADEGGPWPVEGAAPWLSAVSQGQVVILNDGPGAGPTDHPLCGRAAVDRWMSVPVVEKGRVRAFLGVANKRGLYEPEDGRSLSVIASYLWRMMGRLRAERKTRRAIERVRTLSAALEQSAALILVFNTDLRVEYANPAFERLTGRAAADLVGRDVRSVLRWDTDPGTFDKMWATLRAGRVWKGTFRNTDARGRAYWELVSVSPIQDADGHITHFVSHGEDITERTEVEQALQNERTINELQREFIALVSHEFRTPLAVIDSSAQRILRRPDRFARDDVLARMGEVRQMVKHLSELMESVLSLSRLDAGKIKFEPRTVDMTAVVRETCNTHLLVTPGRRITLAVPDDPVPLLGDSRLLAIILSNLLSNAIKYSAPETEILVSVTADDERVHVAVRDHGRGIPENELSRVFTRFFRASTSAGSPGSGIGLYLSRRLAAMHSGDITVTSKTGEGSRFVLTLPR